MAHDEPPHQDLQCSPSIFYELPHIAVYEFNYFHMGASSFNGKSENFSTFSKNMYVAINGRKRNKAYCLEIVIKTDFV